MRLAITLSCLLAGLAAGLAYAAGGDAVVPGTIAYTSYAAGDIYLLENGKRRRIALPGNDSSATWSSDGKRLAFSHTPPRRPTPDLYVVDVSGRNPKPLLKVKRGPVEQLEGELVGVYRPAWSPDGKRIAFIGGVYENFSANPRLLVLELASGKVRRLTNLFGFHVGSAPSWSPDGRRIAFSHCPAKPGDETWGTCAIWSVRVDGTGARKVGPSSRDDAYAPVWSPDGKQIAYSLHRSAVGGLGTWVMPATGGAPRKLAAQSGSPDWSPDGTQLVIDGLYLVTADGSSPPVRLAGVPYGADPVWRP